MRRLFGLLCLLAFLPLAWCDVQVTNLEVKPRYPWNGLVDINFTITGDSGTKYDTSFTAKDMVGNTNITMQTIRKAGFDWTKESLGDVSILCDLPAQSFTITVMEWEGPVTFEITI